MGHACLRLYVPLVNGLGDGLFLDDDVRVFEALFNVA